MGMTLGLGSACTGLLTRGTPSSKGPGEAGHAQLAHHGSPPRLATGGKVVPTPPGTHWMLRWCRSSFSTMPSHCGKFCSSFQPWRCSPGPPRCTLRSERARGQLKPRKRQRSRMERRITKQDCVSKVQYNIWNNHSHCEINQSFLGARLPSFENHKLN